ncbi:hypothetical protein CRG98_050023, partial [Punica granatum]
MAEGQCNESKGGRAAGSSGTADGVAGDGALITLVSVNNGAQNNQLAEPNRTDPKENANDLGDGVVDALIPTTTAPDK